MSVFNVLFDSRIGDTKTIDGVAIGGQTPAAATFTTLTGTTVKVGSIPIATANTIAAGLTTLAASTAITAEITSVTTADSSHVFINLPTAVAGDSRVIINTGGASAQTITIYPQAADTIDGGGAGSSTTLTVAHRIATFYATAANTWVSSLGGAVSS